MLFVILLLAALAAIFLVQNAESVEVHFLFWTLSLSQALLVFFVLAIGMVLGWSLHAYAAYRHRHAISATATTTTSNREDHLSRRE